MNEHGGDVTVEPWPTFLPHLGHHRVLVILIVTGLDTMMRQDHRWNEPMIRNSVVAADARKSTSMAVAPVSVPRMEEHRCREVDEHGQWRRVEWQRRCVKWQGVEP
jgi:hypothetical protein